MAALSLVLTGLFGLLAVGARGWAHVRRTGTSPFRSGGGMGGLMAIGGLGAVLVIGPVTDLVAPPERLLEGTWVAVVGVILAVVGLATTLWAQLAMGDAWRIGVDPTERTALVESGPFRWVRNPIYSAMLVFAAGLTLLVPNVVALAGLIVVVAALELHVRQVEEPYLQRTHGARYGAYAAAVGRFVPGIGKFAN